MHTTSIAVVFAGRSSTSATPFPARAWTYWNKGPGPGEEEYLNSDETDWSNTTATTAAQNLVSVARALQTQPMPAPAS